ncbi:MAG: hypothetical protein WBG02_01460 [Candidatus Acidiferrum sp.]
MTARKEDTVSNNNDPLEVQEMNEQIDEAEKKFADAQIAHGELIAAFKQYLNGKSLDKEYSVVKDPGAVHEG